MSFSLQVLPALHGDALWLEYGHDSPHRVLIDGGPRSSITASLVRELLLDDPSAVELIVVTHIDADHITGVLDVLRDAGVTLEPGDIWFNGWRHLPSDILGVEQGEELGRVIEKRRLPWNVAFNSGPVAVPDEGPLPSFQLPGGLTVIVLSPTRKELAALRPVWKREVEKAGLVPGIPAESPPEPSDLLGDERLDLQELANRPFSPDRSEANGASIAMLAEFEQRSVLLTGDAHAGVLAVQLGRLARERKVDRLPVDLVKLPHHGSRHNVSSELVDAVGCERWVFSTNGSIYSHPDPEAVARIVADRPGVELIFNYRSGTTERFDKTTLRRAHRYRVSYPASGAGIRIDL